MTNLEWIIKQNLKDIILDCANSILKVYMQEYDIDEDVMKCQAYRWLFAQRKEEECITSKKSEQEQTKN